MPYLQTLLQPDEATRAQRFRRSEDQRCFIVTRGILRILAGKYLSQCPADIRFASKINKKPELQDSTEWHINVAHSGNMGLIAFSKASVGIDIERVDSDFSYPPILSHSFSLEEQRYIEAGEDSRLLFYQLWTRKEAVVKATARGIDDDFARIPSLDGVHWVPDYLGGGVPGWTVNSFLLSADYPAAIAHQFPTENLKFYAIDSGALAYLES